MYHGLERKGKTYVIFVKSILKKTKIISLFKNHLFLFQGVLHLRHGGMLAVLWCLLMQELSRVTVNFR